MFENTENLVIASFRFWTLFLHENQSHLGRVYLSATRESAVDFFEMNEEETAEFHLLGNKIVAVLRDLFHPDLMNYASLGNRFRHLHVHFIPRYQGERIFHGVTFFDKKWGQNYAPYDKDFKISEDCLMSVKDAILSSLNK